MLTIHPMRIPGRWREGYVLDYHTVSSTYLGDDQYGHPVLVTKRSEIGDLLFRWKYRANRSALEDLVATIGEFLKSWKPDVDLIIPVPPTRLRSHKPLLTLAKELGERVSIAVRPEAVVRAKEIPELKNVYDFEERLRLLAGAHKVKRSLVERQKVLLFDDLYRSGATMNAITEALYQPDCAAEVCALAVTRTRSRV
jgi:competence protein ComFC